MSTVILCFSCHFQLACECLGTSGMYDLYHSQPQGGNKSIWLQYWGASTSSNILNQFDISLSGQADGADWKCMCLTKNIKCSKMCLNQNMALIIRNHGADVMSRFWFTANLVLGYLPFLAYQSSCSPLPLITQCVCRVILLWLHSPRDLTWSFFFLSVSFFTFSAESACFFFFYRRVLTSSGYCLKCSGCGVRLWVF